MFHNTLVITKNGEKFVSYNSMLRSVASEIAGLRPFSKFLALGVGGGETSQDMVHLESFSNAVELVVDRFNYDISRGELFVSKKLVFDSSDMRAFEIVEAGLSADSGENGDPVIVNRFLVNGGEPIFRDPGEEMTIEVCVYLAFDGLSRLRLTAGSNNLVKFFLGNDFPGGVNFSLARGDNSSLNSEIVDRSDFAGESFSAEVSSSVEEGNSAASVVLSAGLGAGVVEELLLLLNGSPVCRMNVAEFYGVDYNKEIVLAVDKDLSVILNFSGVDGVSEVINSATGASVSGFSTLAFGTSFAAPNFDPFAGKHYLDSEFLAISKRGDRLSFALADGKTDIFWVQGGKFDAVPADVVNSANHILAAMYGDYIVIKATNGEKYTNRCYRVENGAYVSRVFRAADDTYGKFSYSYKWDAFEMADPYRDKEAFSLLIDNGETAMFYGCYLDVFGDIIQGSFSNIPSTYNTAGKAVLCDGSFREKTAAVGYDAVNKRIYFKKYGSIVNYNKKPEVASLGDLPHDAGFPRAGKNYFYTAVSSLGKMVFYSIPDMNIVEKEFGSDVLKFYSSPRLDYVAVCRQSGEIDFFYVDGSLNFYQFSNSIPEEFEGRVVRLEFVQGGVLLFLNDGKNVLMPIIENKVLVGGLPLGASVTVRFGADTTPGAGDIPVSASASFRVYGS